MISRKKSRETITSSVTKETNTVTRLRRLAQAFPAVIAVAAAMLLIAAPAQAADPQFELGISHSPYRFLIGETGSYSVMVTNSGDAATSAPIVLTDTLPPNLALSALTPGPHFSCSGDGSLATPLSCTRAEPLGPGQSDSIQLDVAVSVGGNYTGASGEDLAANTATVSGGGVVGVVSTGDLVAVYPRYALVRFLARTTTDASEATNYTVAGGHPFQTLSAFQFSKTATAGIAPSSSAEELKDAYVELPLGFIGNPAATPLGAPVGEAHVVFGGSSQDVSLGAGGYPILNVEPDYGSPAQFFFNANGVPVVLKAVLHPRTESYALSVGAIDNVLAGVTAVRTRFFGVPAQHDFFGIPSQHDGPEVPFFSNPLDCSEAEPTWKLASNTWQNPGAFDINGLPDLSDPAWLTATETTPPVSGCDDPDLASQFDQTTIGVKPLQGPGPAQADSPTGLAVDLDFPQSNDPTDPNTTYDLSTPQAPEPKDITVKLPAGLAVSPSSADGLGACSDLASDPAGDQVHYDTTKPVTCPDSAKIGTAIATTPALPTRDPQTGETNGAEPIPGDVYLLKPHPGDLPIGGGSQDGKFRLLIQLEHARYGINVKLPGVAVADKQTGQLTTVFTQNPQLPAKHLTVSLKSGARAPLASPVTCGAFTTTATLVPWGTPQVPDANKSASFNVSSGPNGSACANTPAQRPFAPALVTAGPDSPVAGASSPFTLKLTRNDGEQELSSLQATLPKGLAAKFVGIPYCSDAALAAAATRPGKAEQANPSCPASRIGGVTVGAGPGTSPLYTQGTAYLAGPYKGAPMSVAVITPAVAGPFDLGTVVVRNALYVDPETAQGRVVSDPFPKMLDGIPLKLRSILVRLDRPSFTLNPTNCSAMAVNATITSTDGASSSPSVPFQVSGCKDLGFKPDLKLSLKGGTARSDHPALKAVLNYPKGNYANIAKAVVSLPHSEFLAQNHIKTICTRVQFAADQCPQGSIYGFVTATTPLFDAPISGPVYLRSSSNPLPDLVAALHGQVDVDLVGRIDSKNGGIRTTFDAVPDAPVSKFVLTMQGGKKGLLENSKNLCNSVNKADVRFTAQNGRTANSKPVLSNSCKKGKKAKKGKGGSKRTIAWLPSLGF